MQLFLIILFTVLSISSFWLFLRGKYKLSPLWLMLSAWFIAIAISELHLSTLESVWPGKYWALLGVSLASFVLGFFAVERFVTPVKEGAPFRMTGNRLRWIIYALFLVSVAALYLFYKKAGDFPLLADDPDAFRFVADNQVPGLVNYLAQLARIYIPLSFYLFFTEGFNMPWRKVTQPRLPTPGGQIATVADRRKHLLLAIVCVIGTISLILFASRTQIFFIDLWVMGLYLLMRKPNLKQALKFYPAFLLISILVLAAVPLYRQYQSYGADYLGSITGIDTSHYNKFQKALVPIYVGVSFNQQALLHAEQYYQTHELQYGKVALDPFTNIFGKIIKPLNNLKSHYDLGAIFYPWWNTGTYLFPFVQDFGTSAFYWVPFVFAGLLTLLWKYWQSNPSFLSINLYAYAYFFIVMTVYLSFTVRAEMYLDLMLLLVCHLFVSNYEREN
jgi:hypothetical protein